MSGGKNRCEGACSAIAAEKQFIHLSLEILSFMESEGKVCYPHGKDTPEEERMDYVENLSNLVAMIEQIFGICGIIMYSN